MAGCGGGRAPAAAPARHGRAPARRPVHRAPVRLHVSLAGRLPAPVQLPGLAAVRGAIVAAGGLDGADSSVADIVRVAPGRPAAVGSLPQPAHDAPAAALGGAAYVFGGG